ncbi:MAG: alpha/beta hydrolase, partial [Betaproteobacteria bacterium]|nr:alpha/beta hydrolase [Betaproteobacteria bacterium]
GLNYYRATPLVPPTDDAPNARAWQPQPDELRVRVPTLVLWGMDDIALLPGLLDGLEAFVPQLTVQRIAGATHWVVHEHTADVARRIDAWLAETPAAA